MGGEAGSSPLGARFAGLEGKWRLERHSSDGSLFSGSAAFSRLDESVYLLREEGTLRLPGGETLSARREWTWHLALPDEIEIRYLQEAGGGLYHRFRPRADAGAWTGEAEHLCGRDIYCAAYRLDDGELAIDHVVRGPAKNYVLKARYRRVA